MTETILNNLLYKYFTPDGAWRNNDGRSMPGFKRRNYDIFVGTKPIELSPVRGGIVFI